MQNTKKSEQGNSLSVVFDTHEGTGYDVEFSDFGNDIIYHFWPNEGLKDFPPGFSKTLEDSFKSVLPMDSVVFAEYRSKEEAAALLRYGQDPNKEAIPVPTYYVRVVGWADNPMSDKFLKNKVFSNLDDLILRDLADS